MGLALKVLIVYWFYSFHNMTVSKLITLLNTCSIVCLEKLFEAIIGILTNQMTWMNTKVHSCLSKPNKHEQEWILFAPWGGMSSDFDLCWVHPHMLSYQWAQEQVEFLFCLGSALTCVQVPTYLARVVMEMLHIYLLRLSQLVADCSVPTLCVTHKKSSFWPVVVLLTSCRILYQTFCNIFFRLFLEFCAILCHFHVKLM